MRRRNTAIHNLRISRLLLRCRLRRAPLLLRAVLPHLVHRHRRARAETRREQHHEDQRVHARRRDGQVVRLVPELRVGRRERDGEDYCLTRARGIYASARRCASFYLQPTNSINKIGYCTELFFEGCFCIKNTFIDLRRDFLFPFCEITSFCWLKVVWTFPYFF